MSVSSTLIEAKVGDADFVVYAPNEFQSIMEGDIHNTFLNPEEHGESAIFYSAFDNSVYSIDGIFDNEYDQVSTQAEAGVVSSDPRFRVAFSKLRYPENENDYVRIRGKRYRILFRDSDGTGIVELKLKLL